MRWRLHRRHGPGGRPPLPGARDGRARTLGRHGRRRALRHRREAAYQLVFWQALGGGLLQLRAPEDGSPWPDWVDRLAPADPAWRSADHAVVCLPDVARALLPPLPAVDVDGLCAEVARCSAFLRNWFTSGARAMAKPDGPLVGKRADAPATRHAPSLTATRLADEHAVTTSGVFDLLVESFGSAYAREAAARMGPAGAWYAVRACTGVFWRRHDGTASAPAGADVQDVVRAWFARRGEVKRSRYDEACVRLDARCDRACHVELPNGARYEAIVEPLVACVAQLTYDCKFADGTAGVGLMVDTFKVKRAYAARGIGAEVFDCVCRGIARDACLACDARAYVVFAQCLQTEDARLFWLDRLDGVPAARSLMLQAYLLDRNDVVAHEHTISCCKTWPVHADEASSSR